MVALLLTLRGAVGRRPLAIRDIPTRDRASSSVARSPTTVLNLSIFIAFVRIDIALALLVFYSYPAFVALASVGWFGERLDRRPLGRARDLAARRRAGRRRRGALGPSTWSGSAWRAGRRLARRSTCSPRATASPGYRGPRRPRRPCSGGLGCTWWRASRSGRAAALGSRSHRPRHFGRCSGRAHRGRPSPPSASSPASACSGAPARRDPGDARTGGRRRPLGAAARRVPRPAPAGRRCADPGGRGAAPGRRGRGGARGGERLTPTP